MSNKHLFLSLKGIGDTIILLNFLSKQEFVENKNIKIIISEQHKFLKYLIPKNITVNWVPDCMRAIYFIKRKYHKIYSIFLLRRLVKANLSEGYKLVFFDNYLKNKLFFFGIKKEIINSKSIYKNLENYFNVNVSYPLIGKTKKVIIFPFGDNSNRRLSSKILKKIITHIDKFNYEYEILIHSSTKIFLNNTTIKNLKIYNEFNELNTILNDKPIIITVDTFFLHFSVLKQLNIFVLSDSWKNYIPHFLIENNRFFKYKQINTLLSSLNASN